MIKLIVIILVIIFVYNSVKNKNVRSTDSVPEQPIDSSALGKCPKCGRDVYKSSNGYECKCKWFFSYRIKGTYIDEHNIRLILQGKKTDPLYFNWDNGKSGYARLYLQNDTLCWDFC